MTSYTFRLDNELKTQAFSVFKSYGVNPAQAIKMFLRQVVETNSIPVKLDYQPNAQTLEAMQDALAGNTEKLTALEGESLAETFLRIATEPEND